jgi:glycosyltransferase involved in cell wall biosynthesis
MVKVAVLIPVYNDFPGLIAALNSLEFPSGACFEVVVVDDGSDGKVVVDSDFFNGKAKLTILSMAKNSGITAALNYGLDYILAGDYEFVARLDSGDYACPNRLAVQLGYFKANPTVGLIGGSARFFWQGEDLFDVVKPATKEAVCRRLRFNSAFCHTTVMIRVAVLREVGPYSEDYPAAEDYELFWRISKRYDVANVKSVLVRVENNPEGISLGRRREQLRSRLKIQMAYFDVFIARSYLGVVQTLLFMVTPVSIIVWIKKKLGVVN